MIDLRIPEQMTSNSAVNATQSELSSGCCILLFLLLYQSLIRLSMTVLYGSVHDWFPTAVHNPSLVTRVWHSVQSCVQLRLSTHHIVQDPFVQFFLQRYFSEPRAMKARNLRLLLTMQPRWRITAVVLKFAITVSTNNYLVSLNCELFVHSYFAYIVFLRPHLWTQII